MDDGTEHEFGPGDAGTIPPGHDAWIVGDEACVWLDFSGADEYAKGLPRTGRRLVLKSRPRSISSFRGQSVATSALPLVIIQPSGGRVILRTSP